MLTHKIQITLTPEEVTALSYKSQALGYNVTKYIKFLAMREAYSIVESTPELSMSRLLENKVIKAVKEHRSGRTKKLDSLADLDRI